MSATIGVAQLGESPLALQTQQSQSSAASQQSISSPKLACQLRYGLAEDRGSRGAMEDAMIAVADLAKEHDVPAGLPECRAFFGVFDGHGGSQAARFASHNMLSYLVAQQSFPDHITSALREAFLQTDREFYQQCQAMDFSCSAGTTALAALIWGRKLYLANAGDSRAVLCSRGKAIELTRDHKPETERERIERAGGFVCPEGRLNGELGTSRAIGDYHYAGIKRGPGDTGPLTAEPDTLEHCIAAEDEFLLLACDGLWDVFPSQRAVEYARARLREHNQPARCAQELVEEALRMHTSDNVSVIAVCFSQDPPPARTYNTPFQRNISREGLNRLSSYLQ